MPFSKFTIRKSQVVSMRSYVYLLSYTQIRDVLNRVNAKAPFVALVGEIPTPPFSLSVSTSFQPGLRVSIFCMCILHMKRGELIRWCLIAGEKKLNEGMTRGLHFT